MKAHGLGSTPAVTAGGLLFVLFLSGCPFGDCWGTADVTVTVDSALSPPANIDVLVAEVTRIYDSDVTGTSPEGLPIGPAAASPRIFEATFDTATATWRAHDGMTNPYPAWFYAFVDLNGNRKLDSGEPFGVDPKNPSSSGGGTSCKSTHYQGAIVINRKLP